MKNLDLPSVMLKAIDNLYEGITISNMTLPDYPLVYVNKGFIVMTGYSAEECIHRNCRFLQGSGTDPEAVSTIHKAVKKGEAIQTEILNYHKDGTPFWNYLSLTPLPDNNGRITHYIGIQEDITARKMLLEKEEELKEQRIISEVSIEAQESERREIGKDLHDNVNQLIVTLRLYLQLIKEKPENCNQHINIATSLVDNILKEVRLVSHQLIGPSFSDSSLGEALNDLVVTIQNAVPFEIQLSYQKHIEALIDAHQKLMIYRIVQEQMNNIVKYAKPKLANISLHEEDGLLQLMIQDDGVGFNPAEKSRGVGFKNISHRVKLENGSLSIHAMPGKGCRVNVLLPLKAGASLTL